MDGTVIFCNDGVLRFRHVSDDRVVVPMKLLQREEGVYPFFCRFLRHSIEIEEGTTFGQFLLALEPWADVVSTLTDRRVDHYISELRKMSAEESAFDKIEIRNKYGASQNIYQDPDRDILADLSNPNRPPLTFIDTFQFSAELDITGYKHGDPSNYSVSYNSIHELKNVPLIINRNPIFSIGYYSKDTGIFKRGTPAKKLGKNGKVQYLQGTDEWYTLDQIIRCVVEVGLFFNEPSSGTAVKEELSETMSEIDEIAESITKSEEAPENMTIAFAPDAFSGVKNYYDREGAEWEDLKKELGSDSRFPMRIGKIKETVPTDNRAFGQFLEK